jgi:ribosomal protein S18 acetylase RimI-like enzyme
MSYIIRKALPHENIKIARAIANSYSEELSSLTKDQDKASRAFEVGINTDKFWVCIEGNEIIGISACSDIYGRAFIANRKDCTKNFGLILGNIAYLIFKSEFAKKLPYPETTGYIEFVGVVESARGRGIAKKIMSEIINESKNYNEFILDVTDNNVAAIKSYEKLGFVEFKRTPFRGGKSKGIKEKVYMRLAKV